MEKYKKSLIVTLGLQALTLILWFLPMFSSSILSYEINSLGEKLYKTHGLATASFVECFEGATGLLIFFIAMHLVATICVGFPLKKGDLDKQRRFIVPKISAFLTIGFWWLLLSSVLDKVKEYKEYGARGGLTFSGWLFAIAMAALIVMLFWLSRQSKNICEQKEKNEFVADAYARKAAGIEPIPAGGWRCSCGRAHAAYVSSCPCGICKSDAQQHVV